MKKKLTLLTLLFGSMALMAFNGLPKDGDIIKVSVVHYDGGKVMVLDTSFSASSGYTVEQFLLDNDLDPNTTEIIDADNLEGAFVHDMQHDVWFMDGAHTEGTRVLKTMTGDHSGNEFITREHKGGKAHEVKIMEMIGDDGDVKIQKWVNGEEVPAGEGDMLWIKEDGSEIQLEGDLIFIHEDGAEEGSSVRITKIAGDDDRTPPGHRIKIINQGEEGDFDAEGDVEMMEVEIEKTVGPDGEEQILMWINGEEVDPADHSDLLNPGNGDGEFIIEIDYDGDGLMDGENNIFIIEGSEGEMNRSLGKMLDVEVEETIGPDGEVVIQMWIDGEEVDPADHQSLLNPANGEGDNQFEMETEVIIFRDNCEGMDEGMIHDLMSGMSYTVAIVTHGVDEVPVEKSIEAKQEAIQKLQFSPNPNSGQFTLSFNLPEKGRTVVNIYDLQGKLVFEDNLGRFQGEYRRDIDISSAGSGTYILNVIQGQNKLAEKIIVQ